MAAYSEFDLTGRLCPVAPWVLGTRPRMTPWVWSAAVAESDDR